jgi:hypothetical protein
VELKQKQVNAFEARSTRELAEDTALQGKVGRVLALESFCFTGPTLNKSDNPLLHHRNHSVCKSLSFLTGGNRL